MAIVRKIVTAERVRELFDYSPGTGEFRFRGGPCRGSVAGSPHAAGYRRLFIDGRQFYAHRMAWLYIHGFLPNELDHANLDKSDNRICNLRIASRSQNMANLPSKNTLGRKGVWRDARQKVDGWFAYVRGKRLGTFSCIEHTAAAYKAAVEYLYGNFSRV
jgi:hypothetical protein